jgi:DNA polymerase III epsilon subunit-like protein
MRAGFTSFRYGDQAQPEELLLGSDAGGSFGLAFGLFKALQLVHSRGLRDSFRDFVAVDVETTDFDRDACEVIDLGAVRVEHGKLVAEFQSPVAARRPIAPEAERIHHITEEEIRGAPRFEEVWPAFREFCGDHLLVAHNGNQLDFPVLRRLAADLPAAQFVGFDSLPLARNLHPGSRKLVDLAHAFGVELVDEHRALGDSRALAEVFLKLQDERLARSRKTALSYLVDYLGLALALSPEPLHAELQNIAGVAKLFALGRYSDCLDHYRLERALPGAETAPTLEEVIDRLGGQAKLRQFRRDRRAEDRYPVAMTRLRRLLADAGGGASLADQLRGFLDRIALSRSDVTEPDRDLAERVNLLTLHSTKGLEFSRVYIVGVEDGQLARVDPDGRGPSDDELQESRRLLYVGMTRAKDRLILTRSESRWGQRSGGHRFLDEMGLTPRPPD